MFCFIKSEKRVKKKLKNEKKNNKECIKQTKSAYY